MEFSIAGGDSRLGMENSIFRRMKIFLLLHESINQNIHYLFHMMHAKKTENRYIKFNEVLYKIRTPSSLNLVI
jgi:hypothetical protein